MECMGRNENFGESFGLSRQEQNEITGHAMGAHLWQGVNNILGDYGTHVRSAAYDELRGRFPNHEVHLDEDSSPYVEHKQGPWSARYHGGTYVHIHHAREGEQDVIGSSDQHAGMGSEELKAKLSNWVAQNAPDHRMHRGK